MTDIAERYLACWNETDPQQRRALIERHWAEDATYTDPLAAVAGREAVEATIAAVQAQFPGFVFTQLGESDAHHDQARGANASAGSLACTRRSFFVIAETCWSWTAHAAGCGRCQDSTRPPVVWKWPWTCSRR